MARPVWPRWIGVERRGSWSQPSAAGPHGRARSSGAGVAHRLERVVAVGDYQLVAAAGLRELAAQPAVLRVVDVAGVEPPPSAMVSSAMKRRPGCGAPGVVARRSARASPLSLGDQPEAVAAVGPAVEPLERPGARRSAVAGRAAPSRSARGRAAVASTPSLPLTRFAAGGRPSGITLRAAGGDRRAGAGADEALGEGIVVAARRVPGHREALGAEAVLGALEQAGVAR